MEFRVLGPLEVVGPQSSGVPAGNKERTVLARLLIDAGRPVPVDALLEAAWPDAPPGAAARSLRVRLAGLRAFLDPAGVLVREGAAYRLAVEPEQVDAGRFERLVAAQLWDEALALWRGPPYADFAYAEFAQQEIARLEDLHARAEEGRARALIEQGRPEEALPGLRGLVARAPLAEEPARALALALYRAGRQVEALDALRALAARLLELGLEPGREARELERQILRHDAALDRPPTPRHDPALDPIAAAVSPPTRFFGREADLARAAALAAEGPLLTIAGVGGAGKTRLARELAARLAASYPDGCWWSELAPLSDPADIPGAVADAIGLDPSAGSAGLARVAGYVATRHALLVLDNCEHLLDGAAEAAERLLGACPRLLIVATSRAPLDIEGERVLRLGGLEDPADGPAVALFVDRARAAGSLVDPLEQLEDVVALCRRLDCLPLAIELAAARTRSHTPADIGARLHQRLGLPGVAGRRAARHSTLEAAIDWSYRLLDQPQRRLFERLSVFNSPSGADAVAGVCSGAGVERADVPGLLDLLVARSLVVATAEDGRAHYGLLQTLREFAAGRLRDRGEEPEVRDRHARHVAEVAHGLTTDPGRWGAGLPFADRFEELRAAVRWAMERDAGPTTAFTALAPMWGTAHSRHADDIAALAERALDHWPDAAQPLRAGALGTAAVARLVCGDGVAARRHADAALALEPRLGGPAWIARRVHVLMGFYHADPARSLELARDFAQRARAAGQPMLATEMDGFVVHALDAAGDHDAAIAAAAAMRAEADRLGVAILHTWSRYVTGVAWLERDAGEAHRWLADALAESRRIGHHNVARASLRGLAVAALIEGRAAEAAERLDEALARDEAAADAPQQWATVMAAAAIAAEQGRSVRAAELLAAADAFGPDLPLATSERALMGRARRRIEDDLSAAERERAAALGCRHDLATARRLAREALDD